MRKRVTMIYSVFAVLALMFYVFVPFARADGGLTADKIATMIGTVISGLGALWSVWGIVSLALALREHNGPGLQQSILHIAGGLMLLAAGALASGWLTGLFKF